MPLTHVLIYSNIPTFYSIPIDNSTIFQKVTPKKSCFPSLLLA